MVNWLAIDSLGRGFLTSALLSFYFYKRFGLHEGQIAALLVTADVLNVTSNVLARRIARRIGLVNTMVSTHLPSSLLMLLPFRPTFRMAAALFLLRELLIDMDVPTPAVIPRFDRRSQRADRRPGPRSTHSDIHVGGGAGLGGLDDGRGRLVGSSLYRGVAQGGVRSAAVAGLPPPQPR